MPNNLLITARPGAGKTTLIRRVAERLTQEQITGGGFYTAETRQAGHRTGFQVVALDGREGTLADVGKPGGPRVGKYRVRVGEFQRVGVDALESALRRADVVILDEIGKMELLAPAFPDAVRRALDSPKPLVGTLGQARHPLVDEIGNRPDIRVMRLTEANREELVETVVTWVKGKLGGVQAADGASAG